MQLDQKLLLEDNLIKSKSSLARITQTEEAVQTVKSKIDLLQTSMDEKHLASPKGIEKGDISKVLAFLKDNDDMVRQVLEKVQLLEAARENSPKAQDYEDGEVVSQSDLEVSTEGKKKTVGLQLMSYEDMDLARYLDTSLGAKLKELLVTMADPDNVEERALNDWWDFQKRKWTKNGKELKALPAWYRLVSWWSSQFIWTWTTLTTEFMVNPFQLSLQEIVYKVALLKNLLNGMGLIHNSEPKLKWVEPFIKLGKTEPRLSEVIINRILQERN